MSRPSKYKQEYIKRAEKYLKETLKADELPTVEGLAIELDVSRATLYNWGDKHPEFLDTLERLKLLQADTLINRGLDGTYNASIVKLMLSCNHGMHERSDKHLSGGLTFAEALHKEMTDDEDRK